MHVPQDELIFLGTGMGFALTPCFFNALKYDIAPK